MKKYNLIITSIFIFSFLGCHTPAISAIDLIPFCFEGKYGYLNSELQIAIKPQFIGNVGFRITQHFSKEGFAVVSFGPYMSSGAAIIDKKGNKILSLNYGEIKHIYDDLYNFQNYIIRLKDKKIIASNVIIRGASSKGEYILAEFYNEDQRYVYIDSEGNRVLQHLKPTRYSCSFFEQRAVVTTEDWEKEIWTTQIIDTEGNVVSKIPFWSLGCYFSEGLLPAHAKDGRKGYINRSGEFEFLLPNFFSYEAGVIQATDFSDGYAAFQISEKPETWRIINKQGQFVSEAINVNEMEKFSDGLSLVRVINWETRKNLYGYVNTSGKFIVNLYWKTRMISAMAMHGLNIMAEKVYLKQTARLSGHRILCRGILLKRTWTKMKRLHIM